MANVELLYFDQPDQRSSCHLSAKQSHTEGGCGGGEPPHSSGGQTSAPWTETLRAEEETAFRCKHDEDERLVCQLAHLHEDEEEDGQEEEQDDVPELFLLSDEDLSSDGSGKSVDYGFIIAVTCLITGISLVAITYTVPRDVRVDPDSVSAREMERLERDRARVGAHLDRCVIAGLCLLTMGGVLLSTLLMVSMWKGEMMRRRALADYKHAARLYGSLSLRTGSSQTLESCSQLSGEEDDLELLS
ncbi:Transmembrane protein 74 [Oryzias melastigma]|uniref:Transmembrane protein 74 n=1 Tax=Oryzias melastigma TaxID=30732 RepID=A0A834F9T7_ORYME|nr:Transmembrane protein 74 [Oryzias melastigma]